MEKASKENAFYFYTSVDQYTGESASSLEEFLDKVRVVDIESLEFHLQRGDFKKWFREVWFCEELVEKTRKIERLGLKGEALRTHAHTYVSNFLKTRRVKANARRVLKEYPPPPEEHSHELKMEKHLKKMFEEGEKKERK